MLVKQLFQAPTGGCGSEVRGAECPAAGTGPDSNAIYVATRCSGQRQGEALPAPHRRCRRELCVLVVDIPLGEAVEQLVEGVPALQPRQVGAAEQQQHGSNRSVSSTTRFSGERSRSTWRR